MAALKTLHKKVVKKTTFHDPDHDNVVVEVDVGVVVNVDGISNPRFPFSSKVTIRPSSIWAIRCAKSKMRASWVTMMRARSGRTAVALNNSITTWPVCPSSADVGSSQTISFGS